MTQTMMVWMTRKPFVEETIKTWAGVMKTGEQSIGEYHQKRINKDKRDSFKFFQWSYPSMSDDTSNGWMPVGDMSFSF